MRNLYPKFITTLFLVLSAAVVLKYTDADSKSNSHKNHTPHIDKTMR